MPDTVFQAEDKNRRFIIEICSRGVTDTLSDKEIKSRYERIRRQCELRRDMANRVASESPRNANAKKIAEGNANFFGRYAQTVQTMLNEIRNKEIDNDMTPEEKRAIEEQARAAEFGGRPATSAKRGREGEMPGLETGNKRQYKKQMDGGRSAGNSRRFEKQGRANSDEGQDKTGANPRYSDMFSSQHYSGQGGAGYHDYSDDEV